MIVASDPKRGSETLAEKIDRLGVQDAQKKRQNQEEAAQQCEHSFKPQINMISAYIAPPISIIEKSQSYNKRKQDLQRLKEQKEIQDCTFTPQTNPVSQSKKSVYSVENQKEFS